MSKKKKLIPKLRFPEFKNEGEWEEKELSEIGETVNGLTGKSSSDFGSGKPYVTYKQVFDSSKIDFSECGSVNIYEDENQNILKKGDILFTTSSETPNEVGFASILLEQPKEPIYLNSFCFALRPFDLKKNKPKFSRYLFHSPIYRKSVSSLAQGSTRYNISKVAFLTQSLPFPLKSEQQKIAECLSSLDEIIEAERNKLEKLKEHKKGLMQNLFPQEGKKVPKLRFPEFKNTGEWEYIYGNNLFRAISNKNHNSLLPILAITQENGAIPRNSIQYNVIVSRESIKNYKVVEVGDFVISLRSFQGGIEYSNYNGICSPAYIILRREKNLKNLFFKYFFKTDLYIKKINKNLEGIRDGKMVSFKQFSEIKLPFPSIIEQQKIADSLSSLDELITAQANKIEKLKEHKKGLMQGLFPVTN